MQADTNYIYILLAVAYVIYSIIKAGKKVIKNRPTIDKKVRPSPVASSQPAPKPERGDDFKKMLEELMGESSEMEIPEKSLDNRDNYRENTKPQQAKMDFSLPKKEKISPQPPKPFLRKKTKSDEPIPFLSHEGGVKKISNVPVKAEKEEAQVDFDIRQAIIYSEILKRPQY